MNDQTVFPTFKYADAHAAIEWLERVLGAERIAVHEDGARISHAELRLGNSAIMLGSLEGGRATPPGGAVTYVVVPARTPHTGARSMRPPTCPATRSSRTTARATSR